MVQTLDQDCAVGIFIHTKTQNICPFSADFLREIFGEEIFVKAKSYENKKPK